MPIMQITETEIPTPSTPYGAAVVTEYRNVERMVQAQRHGLSEDTPRTVLDGIDAIGASVGRAARQILENESELTPEGMRKRWATVVAPTLFSALDVVEGEQVKLEAQIAKTEESAGEVRLPQVSGEAAILRALEMQERRRYLSEMEIRKPGSVYESAMRAAVVGDDDGLLAAIGDAPRESGLRLPDEQRDKIKAQLVSRRAPWLGSSNTHASALSRVLRSARAFAQVASGADREPR
jgi:hypothetical protein